MAGFFLTEDVLIMMFTYLPLTSICKFKSVSKVWFSILSNPYFINKWFQFNNPNKSRPWIRYDACICLDGSRLKNYACPSSHSEFISRHVHGFSFRFLMDLEQFQGKKLFLVGSSNGLVLCYTKDVNYRRRYYVCNPLTKQWVSLPSPPPVNYRRRSMSRENCVIGFFCEYKSSYTTTCYKVVRITSSSRVKAYADIFCSNLAEWKTFEASFPVNVALSRSHNVVTNDGVLYWINEERRIIAYNLNNYGTDGCQCSFLNLPDEYGGYRDHILGESEGLLCYARITRSLGTLSVWVLKEDNWQSLYMGIDLNGILVNIDLRKPSTSPMLSSAEQVKVVSFNPVDHHVVLLGCWDCIWGFNCRTRSFEELCCPSLFLANNHFGYFPLMRMPFVLTPMPTILPPPPWKDTLNHSLRLN